MFEKEAEEYCTHQKLLEDVRDNICKAFEDGAEFGYNKAKEEMQKNGLALQSDMDKTIEQNIQLKKQNKWLEGCKSELAEHLGKANDRISELEQQIEKMKCCHNCKHFAYSRCELRQLGFSCLCNSFYKWEIKENE